MIIRKDCCGKVQYEFYQKPTNSGRYLHYDAHCSMSLKTNIVRTEAARVYKCSSNKDDIWKHLETISQHFISSGYPAEFVATNIMEGVRSASTTAHTPKARKKEDYTHILRVPYYSII